ncbi:S-layer homology domain-containing protein, partial [Oscillibacter sp.]|uniref:S-layer homology domain-containing protein n=1 Tax=Oscillibacter sp. TaxID=1945593 RepID=UPI002D7E4FCD
MKKTLAAFLLALTLLTGGAAAFSDVDEGLYYAAPIAWAVERGITTGTSQDTFSPDALCTQGQILTFLWRAAGSPQAEIEVLETASLNADFAQAIGWATQRGILDSGHCPPP